MTPSPIPAQIAAAEGELPDEIAEAIDDALMAQHAFDLVEGPDKARAAHRAALRAVDARAALRTTILARLAAAETARDEAVARAERLEEALQEAAEWHDSKADNLRGRPQSIDTRWRTTKHVEEAERIRAAFTQPAPAEKK